ncbi:MAG: TIGR04282 family arsenosugar biosynthesis glycosyltransferase [Alcanivoracaceae bacterium]
MASDLLPAAIAVFARPPVAGQVKTRLAATVGDQRALETYQRLLQLTVARVSEAGCPWMLFSAGASTPLAALAVQAAGSFHLQEGEQLGERMIRALLVAHRVARRVILIGCDCPALTGAHLQQALAALEEHEVVVGPAEDGGFWLLGSSAAARWQDTGLLSGVPYGGADALSRTCERLQQQGSISTMLPLLWDLDTEADYWRAVRENLL